MSLAAPVKTTKPITLIMLRLLDVTIALILLILLLPLLGLLLIMGLLDTGSPLFVQTRLGKGQQPFQLIKLRSMSIDTEQVATHLVNANKITAFGRLLRATKLDELPQLVNVLKGDMSLVGPRPGLPTQVELIQERVKRKIFDHKPGLTGLGQISHVDMSTPRKLARYDALMLKHLNHCTYLKLLLWTVMGKGQGDRVKQ